jgi:hypothetical protein
MNRRIAISVSIVGLNLMACCCGGIAPQRAVPKPNPIANQIKAAPQDPELPPAEVPIKSDLPAAKKEMPEAAKKVELASEIAKAFLADYSVANRKYGGKAVELDGTVYEARWHTDRTEGLFVVLEPTASGCTIIAHFDREHAKSVLALKKGARAMVNGTVKMGIGSVDKARGEVTINLDPAIVVGGVEAIDPAVPAPVPPSDPPKKATPPDIFAFRATVLGATQPEIVGKFGAPFRVGKVNAAKLTIGLNLVYNIELWDAKAGVVYQSAVIYIDGRTLRATNVTFYKEPAK